MTAPGVVSGDVLVTAGGCGLLASSCSSEMLLSFLPRVGGPARVPAVLRQSPGRVRIELPQTPLPTHRHLELHCYGRRVSNKGYVVMLVTAQLVSDLITFPFLHSFSVSLELSVARFQLCPRAVHTENSFPGLYYTGHFV